MAAPKRPRGIMDFEQLDCFNNAKFNEVLSAGGVA
jgi:hypothetical protein